jgi:uncharacterized protein
MIKTALLGFIRLYQMAFSPLKGPTCRFIPSCSEYAREAIQHFGPCKGLYLGIWRVLRCHPFHPGGYDPVLKNPTRQ